MLLNRGSLNRPRFKSSTAKGDLARKAGPIFVGRKLLVVRDAS